MMQPLASSRVEDANLEAIAFFKKAIAKAALAIAYPAQSKDDQATHEKLLGEINFKSRLHPLFVALAGKHIPPATINNELLSAIQDLKSESTIRFSLRGLNDPVPVWVELFLNYQKRAAQANGLNDFTFATGCDYHELSVQQFQNSLLYLEKHWPSCFVLANSLISEMAFVRFSRFESGVSLNAFGAMFVNPLRRWTFDQYIEVLVHEMSHLQLMLHEQFDTYILNPGFVTDSPIRSDRRPLSGVLHGTFALLRMTEITIKLLENPAGYGENAARRGRYNLHRLKNGLELLTRHGQFSAAGARLIESMKTQTQEFSKSLESI